MGCLKLRRILDENVQVLWEGAWPKITSESASWTWRSVAPGWGLFCKCLNCCNLCDLEWMAKQLFLNNPSSIDGVQHFSQVCDSNKSRPLKYFSFTFMTSFAESIPLLLAVHRVFKRETKSSPWKHQASLGETPVFEVFTPICMRKWCLGRKLQKGKPPAWKYLASWVSNWLCWKMRLLNCLLSGRDKRKDLLPKTMSSRSRDWLTPLQDGISNHPWLQQLLNGRQQTLNFHGFCSQPRKRLIFEHFDSQVAQSTGCAIGSVMSSNLTPDECNILFQCARHDCFGKEE